MHIPLRRWPRPTYAGVVSTLALVLAMSMGGAYAADKIGSGGIKKNAIKTRHIAAGNVTGSDVSGNAVGSQHIIDGQVATSDIADKAITIGKLAPDAMTKVFHYQFAAHNFATTASVSLMIPGPLTPEEVYGSAWSVHLVRASGNVYPIPGPGVNGTSEYRVFFGPSSGAASISITRLSGVGEDYVSIRVVRAVPTQTQVVTRPTPGPAKATDE